MASNGGEVRGGAVALGGCKGQGVSLVVTAALNNDWRHKLITTQDQYTPLDTQRGDVVGRLSPFGTAALSLCRIYIIVQRKRKGSSRSGRYFIRCPDTNFEEPREARIARNAAEKNNRHSRRVVTALIARILIPAQNGRNRAGNLGSRTLAGCDVTGATKEAAICAAKPLIGRT
jgi:hypothetical protein